MSLRRESALVLGGLAGIIALAWVYLAYLAALMQVGNMGLELSMPAMQPWGLADTSLTFLMWVVMMIAMMTPSAVPLIMLYKQVSQQLKPPGSLSSTWLFLLGYLVVWSGFSALATLAQWGLHSLALLTPMVASASPILGGALLIAAGIYQFTPLKDACLSHCRTPMGFLIAEWRDGPRGVLMMGMRHGLYCVGCCWLLMALLFVGGVMNLIWVAVIAAYILIEKVAPARIWLSRIGGVAVLLWGLWLVAGAVV